jgi:hypothetical protein
MDRIYDDITQQYSVSNQYEVQPLCNAIMCANIGGDPVFVNEKLLLPGTLNQLSITSNVMGDSFSLGGNENEVYGKRSIVVKFSGTGANPLLEVTQKFYKK